MQYVGHLLKGDMWAQWMESEWLGPQMDQRERMWEPQWDLMESMWVLWLASLLHIQWPCWMGTPWGPSRSPNYQKKKTRLVISTRTTK